MSTITITIPLHDPNNIYEGHLRAALDSIVGQTTQPSEVLLSGNTKPTYLKTLLDEYKNYFNIQYFENESNSTSSNLNFLIPRSRSEIVKILFQDDFFIKNTSLGQIIRLFDSRKLIWAASGSKNYDDVKKTFVRNVRPRFGMKMNDGVNTIGCPSVISIRRDSFIEFNEDLVMWLDCEWYLAMRHAHGRPYIFRDFQIASRLHVGQQSHWAKSLVPTEQKIVKALHPTRTVKDKIFLRKCACLQQRHVKR